MSTVCIFEDREWGSMYPLTLSRPAFDCRVGSTSLGRRLMAQIREHHEGPVGFLTRTLFAEWTKRAYPGHHVNQPPKGDTVFLNGRLLCLRDGLENILELAGKGAVLVDGRVAAVRLDAEAALPYYHELAQALAQGEPSPAPRGQPRLKSDQDVRLAGRPWELMQWNAAVIEDDFLWASRHPHAAVPQLHPGAQLLKKEHMIIREDVVIEPGAVVDARSGPVILGEGVRVGHHAVVEGPAYLGPHTTVNAQARLYDGVSAGRRCKLGGEVEATVIQGFTNKQHDGFLGHSYLGEWINLGAGTNNSDLKNNYGQVSIWTPEGVANTGSQFAGVFMGDHSKTAIGTKLNTGTVVGFSCNIFCAGFPPRHIPSFTWLGDGGAEPYRLDKALDVARLVTGRRDVSLEPLDEVIFECIAKGEVLAEDAPPTS